jgi:hypothetical protein
MKFAKSRLSFCKVALLLLSAFAAIDGVLPQEEGEVKIDIKKNFVFNDGGMSSTPINR